MGLQITNEFKAAVVVALHKARTNFDGTDTQYAKQWGINNAVYSTLKNATTYDGLLRDAQWLSIGRELEIQPNQRKWVTAKTDVFNAISEEVEFCQANAKAMIFVDECEIGKTHTAKYLARKLKNCFYVDASQAKTKQQFVRLLARVIGVDDRDKYVKVKANIKYALSLLPSPMCIIDEAGDLEYPAFLELKELWNGTAGYCGWYMIGADGLRAKIERGIAGKKVGYAEIFSRFSSRYGKVVPVGKDDAHAFYKKLITDVMSVNMQNKGKLPQLVNRCLTNSEGKFGGLRRAETLLLLNNEVATN